jgi:hypothetical protein
MAEFNIAELFLRVRERLFRDKGEGDDWAPLRKETTREIRLSGRE